MNEKSPSCWLLACALAALIPTAPAFSYELIRVAAQAPIAPPEEEVPGDPLPPPGEEEPAEVLVPPDEETELVPRELDEPQAMPRDPFFDEDPFQEMPLPPPGMQPYDERGWNGSRHVLPGEAPPLLSPHGGDLLWGCDECHCGSLGLLAGKKCGQNCTDPCGTCRPKWIFRADMIILDRDAGDDTLLFDGADFDVLTGDFSFDHEVGPRLQLIAQGCQWGLELLHYHVEGWESWLSASDPQGFDIYGPGFIITDTEAFAQYTSKLYNSEINLRRRLLGNFDFLIGFRWLELSEDFVVADTLGTWYRMDTNNHIYGVQIGVDGDLWQEGCFTLGGLAKIGAYGNRCDQTTVLDGEPDRRSRDSTSALVAEVALWGEYRFSRHWWLRGGYQVLWLDDVALAPDQLVVNPDPDSAAIHSDGSPTYHGAMVGLMYAR